VYNAFYGYVLIIYMYTYLHVPQRLFSAVDSDGIGQIEMSEYIVCVLYVYYAYMYNALYSDVLIIYMYTYLHVPQRLFSAVDNDGFGQIEINKYIVYIYYINIHMCYTYDVYVHSILYICMLHIYIYIMYVYIYIYNTFVCTTASV